MNNYKTFCTKCVQCGSTTSKAYARAHAGKCKACATGQPREERPNPNLLCPDCGEHYLTPYQKAHHYHCDHYTRATDPVGWANEVRGFNDGPDY